MARERPTYPDFWQDYLRAHANWQTRCVHYCGVGIIIASVVAAVATGLWWLPVLGVILNYAGDWASHFVIERNRPSAFDYPLMSMVSGLRMFVLWISGRMGPELRAAGIDTEQRRRKFGVARRLG